VSSKLFLGRELTVPPQKIIASYFVMTVKKIARVLCGKLYHKNPHNEYPFLIVTHLAAIEKSNAQMFLKLNQDYSNLRGVASGEHLIFI
jgi:hypothetical protein